MRGIDLVGRFGGEEFVVAMPDTNISVAYLVGERLRSLISADPFKVAENVDPVVVTVSIGVGGIESPSDTPLGLLARADAALYQAKRGGRNRVASAAA